MLSGVASCNHCRLLVLLLLLFFAAAAAVGVKAVVPGCLPCLPTPCLPPTHRMEKKKKMKNEEEEQCLTMLNNASFFVMICNCIKN